jgi:Niemann-Pick C1 protein
MVGVGSIGLTILVTYGLCSGFGLFFGPMHNVIPFLFLGIGSFKFQILFFIQFN